MTTSTRLARRLPVLAVVLVAAQPPANVVPQQSKQINEHLEAAWKANSLRPSAKAPPAEFARRVYLDLIGRIPRPEEVKEFVRTGGNRPALVHKLLYDKAYAAEYAGHMANLWTVWLMTRSGNPTYHDQMRDWLTEQFAANTPYSEMVTGLITATGKTSSNGAVNFVLANLGEPTPANRRETEGHFDVIPVTSRTTRLFLGLQTQCVQCHDHPFDRSWNQSSFWGVNAFYRQVQRVGNPPRLNIPGGAAAILELKDDPDVNTDGLVNYERRDGRILPTPMVFVDGERPNSQSSATRRELLAGLVVRHEQFPRAIVNRVWGHLFGRGLNDQSAVDDFGGHNKVIHPDLLDGMGREFANGGYDLKQLFTWICNSSAYQSTSIANETNGKPETDVYFSRMLLKAMTPEQLLESLWTATRGKAAGDREAARDRRKAWTRSLVSNFGDDEGNEVHYNGTVVQALLLMNGREINAEILADGGTVKQAVQQHKGDFGKILAHIYMAALGRMPTDYETAVVRRLGTRTDASYYGDVLWALLNSNEFILNH